MSAEILFVILLATLGVWVFIIRATIFLSRGRAHGDAAAEAHRLAQPIRR